jgi:hypothetical protein
MLAICFEKQRSARCANAAVACMIFNGGSASPTSRRGKPYTFRGFPLAKIEPAAGSANIFNRAPGTISHVQGRRSSSDDVAPIAAYRRLRLADD